MALFRPKLQRDHVISIVRGKDLVGVYVLAKRNENIRVGQEILLAEMPPEKADKIIKLWNSKDDEE